MRVKMALLSDHSRELGTIAVYIFVIYIYFPKRFDVQYGELYFLKEPAKSSSCGAEEEGQGGVLGQVSLKLREGIFLNTDNCPSAGAPRYEQM